MIPFKTRFIFLLCLIRMASAGEKVYKVERIGQCNGSAPTYNATMDFSGLGAINERGGFRLTGAVKVSLDVKKVLCLLITIQKCSSRDLQCEKFFEGFYSDICRGLPDNVFVGDLFAKVFVPAFTCPFRKGQYLAAKIMVDLSRIDFLPFDNAKWLTNLEFFERDGKSEKDDIRRPLGCWFFQMTRTTVRKRGGKGKWGY